jgi:hypothetical protein
LFFYERLKIEKNVKFYNKYVKTSEIVLYMQACDIGMIGNLNENQITSGTLVYQMGAGRPKKPIDILWDGWQNDILDLYQEGGSNVEVKALIYSHLGSFSEDLWSRWLAEEPEFSKTIKKGQQLANAWWERSGRKSLHDKDFSYTGWYMNMKNRYGWRDKQEIDQHHTGEVKIVEIPQRPNDD